MKLPVTMRHLDSSAADFNAQLMSVLAFEAGEDEAIDRAAAGILAAVKARGDAAVLEYTNQFDRLAAASVSASPEPNPPQMSSFPGEGQNTVRWSMRLERLSQSRMTGTRPQAIVVSTRRLICQWAMFFRSGDVLP